MEKLCFGGKWRGNLFLLGEKDGNNGLFFMKKSVEMGF